VEEFILFLRMGVDDDDDDDNDDVGRVGVEVVAAGVGGFAVAAPTVEAMDVAEAGDLAGTCFMLLLRNRFRRDG